MAQISPNVRADAVPAPAPGNAEFAGFGRDAGEAAVNAGAAVTAGLDAIGLEVAQYVRTAFESVGETARGMLGARTLEDVVRLQTDFAKRSFDSVIEHGAKLSELGCLLVGASAGAWGARMRS